MTTTTMMDLLDCSICHDVIVDPVMGPCGHDFCLACIKKWYSTDSQQESVICPLCRAKLPEKYTDMHRCIRLMNISEKLFPEKVRERRRNQEIQEQELRDHVKKRAREIQEAQESAREIQEMEERVRQRLRAARESQVREAQERQVREAREHQVQEALDAQVLVLEEIAAWQNFHATWTNHIAATHK